MEQSPSCEANSHSSSQETPHIVWNAKDRYCIHKVPPHLIYQLTNWKTGFE